MPVHPNTQYSRGRTGGDRFRSFFGLCRSVRTAKTAKAHIIIDGHTVIRIII